MHQAPSHKKGHDHLKIGFGIIALLIAGFFVYKYSYIYIERRKYDQAAVAINKVAEDLRAQGINTEFSRGCGRSEEVFGGGSMSCSVGIEYKGLETKDNAQVIIENVENLITKQGFSQIPEPQESFVFSPHVSGSRTYSMSANSLRCLLNLYSLWPNSDNYQLLFSCSQSARFKLF